MKRFMAVFTGTPNAMEGYGKRFASEADRKRLNAILHPRIAARSLQLALRTGEKSRIATGTGGAT